MFSDYIWFPRINSQAMKEVAIMNRFPCVCFLGTTPLEYSVYFMLKQRIYA